MFPINGCYNVNGVDEESSARRQGKARPALSAYTPIRGGMEVHMRRLLLNERVRLTCDLPERALFHGAIGVVLTHWCAPDVAYEVEFLDDTGKLPIRALLRPDQLEPGAGEEVLAVDANAEANGTELSYH